MSENLSQEELSDKIKSVRDMAAISRGIAPLPEDDLETLVGFKRGLEKLLNLKETEKGADLYYIYCLSVSHSLEKIVVFNDISYNYGKILPSADGNVLLGSLSRGPIKSAKVDFGVDRLKRIITIEQSDPVKALRSVLEATYVRIIEIDESECQELIKALEEMPRSTEEFSLEVARIKKSLSPAVLPGNKEEYMHSLRSTKDKLYSMACDQLLPMAMDLHELMRISGCEEIRTEDNYNAWLENIKVSYKGNFPFSRVHIHEFKLLHTSHDHLIRHEDIRYLAQLPPPSIDGKTRVGEWKLETYSIAAALKGMTKLVSAVENEVSGKISAYEKSVKLVAGAVKESNTPYYSSEL